MNISKCSTRPRASEGVALSDVELPTWKAHPIASMPLPPWLDRFDLLPWSEIEKTLCEGSAVAIHAPGVDARTACATVDARLCIEDFLRYIVGDVLWVVHHAHCPFDGWARERIGDANEAQDKERRRLAGEPPLIFDPDGRLVVPDVVVGTGKGEAAPERDAESGEGEAEPDVEGPDDVDPLEAALTKMDATHAAMRAVESVNVAVNALRKVAPESVEAVEHLRAAAVAVAGLTRLTMQTRTAGLRRAAATAAERANQE